MREKLLTIIVPVYNVAPFLEECLSSLCLPEEAGYLEVLIVNDGSTDNSAEIAQKFVWRYPEIFCLYNKENGGHGSAMNAGVMLARGKYLKVVDGDDWTEKSELKKLLSFLKSSSCDAVATDYCWVNDKTKIKKNAPICAFQGVEYGKEYKFEEIAPKAYLKMHNMTVLTSIFREHCPPFDEHCFYVDNEFILYPIPFINTIAFLDMRLYMYRIGLQSQSIDIRKMQEREEQHRKVLFRLLEYFEKIKGEQRNEAAVGYVADGIARMLTSQFKIYLSFEPSKIQKEKIRELDSHISDCYPEIYHAVRNKFVKLLRLSGYHLYGAACFCLRLKLGLN